MRKTSMKIGFQSIHLALCVLVLFAGCAAANKYSKQTDVRQRLSFDKGWLFKLYETGTDDTSYGLEKAALDDSQWRPLNLPHDWAVEGPFSMDLPNNTGKLPSPGIGWYRKHFSLPEADKDKRIFVDFDGAMSHSKVWLNGEYVGQWPYGYASFRLELTPYIKFGGENILAVRLDNPELSSRWYPGGGIYRHTWLVTTNPIHVAHWGTFVTTPQVSAEKATIEIQTEIQNQSDKDATVSVTQQLFEKDASKPVATVNIESLSVSAGLIYTCLNKIKIAKPVMWDIEKPYLYTVRTTVTQNGKVMDVYETPFGIRTAVFDADKGFLLNGKRVPLNGVCMHHDLGPLGAAISRRAVERQLQILKEMGCNAVRTSHNPPAPEVLEYCDKLGILVIVEAFDCWESAKMKNDYNSVFKEWHEKDVVALVHRDRNHPSVIMWSSGNEIAEQNNTSGGHQLSRHLTALFHREDPTRPVTAGCNYPGASSNGFAKTVDVFGFNYKPHMYKDFAARYPNQPYYSSESSSCVSSRGEYFFPVSESKAEGFFNYQVSSYDLYAPGWASPPDREFKGLDDNPTAAGEFVWTGFDYIGEPTPYNNDSSSLLNFHTEAEKIAYQKQLEEMGGKTPSRSSYFGIVDLCGFKKDRFYLYQSRWLPEKPMAHILPHWNWPGRVGEVTPVHVYTSGDEAELFLNGKSLGRRKKTQTSKEKLKPSGSLAKGKSVTCSSAEEDRSNYARNAIDDNPASRWCASGGSADQWWQVDLGKVQPLKSCVVYWERQAANYQFLVKVSEDSQHWTTVAQADYEGNKPYSLLTFNAAGRYVRIEITGLKGGAWASFYEFQVFDNPSPTIRGIRNPLFDRYRLRWNDVVYEPGELKVIAYKDGKKWAEAVQETTGKAQKLELVSDRKTIHADGRDLMFVTVKVTDKSGRVVPRSNPKLQLAIEGPGEIVATGNGDATDLTSFQSTTRNAYNGLCLVIVRSLDGKTGKIQVTATSEGLESGETAFESQ